MNLKGMRFCFVAEMHDVSISVIGGTTVAAEEKRELFITLLGLFGIGAKTNVGYGILEEIQL
ncbi:MAG: hypothetical protein J6N32_04930 [Clostridia bacterium]|nr:hypothetical protein [Clostridia bacterium]MBP3293075.1 hypothetical protein [Clostridia bacterium]